MQFAVRGLASKMSEPTHAAWKQLVHLVQYIARTEGYHLVHRKTPRGLSNLHDSIRNGSYDFTGVTPKEHHLLEVFSDSDWAGRKDTRRSTSSGSVCLDGQCSYSFQGTRSLLALAVVKQNTTLELAQPATAFSTGSHKVFDKEVLQGTSVHGFFSS